MAKEKKAKNKSRPRADSGGLVFEGLNDPALLEFIRSGQIGGGVGIDGRQALCNAALYRCITLISQSIGMLPLNVLHNDDGRETATEHPVWKLLKRQPNKFQTAYEFKSLLQSHVLQYGNAYARIIRSRGQVIQLVPIHPTAVQVKQRDDWSVHYVVTRKDGGLRDFEADEILHLRDLTDDGLEGMSRVKLAKRALGIAFDAEDAASRIFSEGVMAGGYLATDKALSDKAYNQLQESLQKRYSGKANAGRFMILEEGLPDHPRGDMDADAAADYWQKHLARIGFVRVSDGLEGGDVVLTAYGGHANHAALYLGGGEILHHAYNQLSRREVYNQWWQERTHSVWRHPEFEPAMMRAVENDLLHRME